MKVEIEFLFLLPLSPLSHWYVCFEGVDKTMLISADSPPPSESLRRQSLSFQRSSVSVSKKIGNYEVLETIGEGQKRKRMLIFLCLKQKCGRLWTVFLAKLWQWKFWTRSEWYLWAFSSWWRMRLGFGRLVVSLLVLACVARKAKNYFSVVLFFSSDVCHLPRLLITRTLSSCTRCLLPRLRSSLCLSLQEEESCLIA